MWFVLALLSAIFAALTSILAKVGIEGVNSNLATAIRTVVVVVMAWGMVFLTNAQNGIAEISKRSWLFLVLSGLATGVSWLCYYKALQLGDASKVVPIDKLSVVITLILAFVFLHEQFTMKSLIGCIIIGIGTRVYKLKSINNAITRICNAYNMMERETAQKEGREPVLLPHFTCHQLRHTFCTRLCEFEKRPKFVQYVMGQADIKTTMDVYAEVDKNAQKEASLQWQGSVFIK